MYSTLSLFLFLNSLMAAYAALVSLMNTVEQIQNHPHQLSTHLDHCQIQFVLTNASVFLDFIESYASHGSSIEIARDLEKQIATAAHAAEDAIESHVFDQIHASYAKTKHDLLLDLQKIIVDMDSIKEKVVRVVKEKRGFKDQQPNFPTPAANSSRSPIMVGFDYYLHQLLDVLTGNQPNRRIIAIAGMGGIGKTTLARNVFEKSIITRHFDVRAWVSVSQHYNVSAIFLEALSQLKELTSKMDERLKETNESELGELLYRNLTGRRYLIILDDMWSVEAWHRIKFFFPDNGNGSRLILTTRLLDVANYCGESCVRLNTLHEYECWNIFCKKVFGDEDCPLELKQVGKQIVKMCKGLPLSVTVIGGLLQKSPKTFEYWQNVLENVKSILSSREDDRCLNVLYSSYTHLPAYLKPCFLYMGTFEEDCEMVVSRITKLWVAEGFIKPKGTRILEEIAEDYLKDLIDRSLVSVGKYRKNGKIRSCRIHDLLRDLCVSIAEKEMFFPMRVLYTRENSFAEAILLENYRLRFVAYSSSYLSMVSLPSSSFLIWNMQMLIFEGHCKFIAPVEIWKMRQLRHVQCHNIYLPNPPPSDQEDDFCVLGNLLSLGDVVNFKWTKEVCKRIPNIKKLCLVFDDNLIGYEDCLCLYYLQNLGSCLHNLESLRIKFPFCISRYPVDLLNKRVAFPTSLNKLCLRNLSLTQEDLTMIGSLPHLQVLQLEHNSILGGKWETVNGEFLHLKFLRIDSCDLIYWNVDTPAFQVLEKLIVHDLWQLKEIPSVIGELNMIKLVHLNYCSESASISALEMKKEQESFGNDDLQIQVNISCFNHSLWERVKAESLPINVIRHRPFSSNDYLIL